MMRLLFVFVLRFEHDDKGFFKVSPYKQRIGWFFILVKVKETRTVHLD